MLGPIPWMDAQYSITSIFCLASIVSNHLPSFPWTGVPIQPLSIAGMPFCNDVGSCHHSIVPKFSFLSLINLGYHSIPRHYIYLSLAVPNQFLPQIGVGGDLVPQSPSFTNYILVCFQYGPPSCWNIAECVGSYCFHCHHIIYTLLVCYHQIYMPSPLCANGGCTVLKNASLQPSLSRISSHCLQWSLRQLMSFSLCPSSTCPAVSLCLDVLILPLIWCCQVAQYWSIGKYHVYHHGVSIMRGN